MGQLLGKECECVYLYEGMEWTKKLVFIKK